MDSKHDIVRLKQHVADARTYAEAIIATIREPLLVLNDGLRVVSANRSFYRTFMVSESEALGKFIYELDGAQWDIPSLHYLLETILPNNKSFFDYKIALASSKKGSYTLLLNACEVIVQDSGENLIILAIEVLADSAATSNRIEGNKEHDLSADHSMRELELEEKVRQRTQQLHNANALLASKNEELELMNNELNSFTYVSSHDLQEPLRKIQTFANLILERESLALSSTGQDYFRRMQLAAARMQRLIEDLLEFSRLTTAELKFKNTNILTIVNDVVNELKDSIREKNANVQIIAHCDAYIIPFQFHQLINNLISNALKFSKPDVPPDITIESRKIQSTNREHDILIPNKMYCHIRVTDNGIGFENHFNKRIFEVFQRLHGKDQYPGTGIGLAIVKKIVENHHGVVSATSELGKGTTIDIYIPDDLGRNV